MEGLDNIIQQESHLLGKPLTLIINSFGKFNGWKSMYLDDGYESFLITKMSNERRDTNDRTSSNSSLVNVGINAIEMLTELDDEQVSQMTNQMTQLAISGSVSEQSVIDIYLYEYGKNGGEDFMGSVFERVNTTEISPQMNEVLNAVAKAKRHRNPKLKDRKEMRHKLDDGEYDFP